MVIPPFFCFEGTVYDVTNLACGVAHFQAECLAHYSPVRVAHIAPESLAHFTPVEVAHYAPVCSTSRLSCLTKELGIGVIVVSPSLGDAVLYITVYKLDVRIVKGRYILHVLIFCLFLFTIVNIPLSLTSLHQTDYKPLNKADQKSIGQFSD